MRRSRTCADAARTRKAPRQARGRVVRYRLIAPTAMTAMKSTLEPEDLAGACVFFASDDAKFVTGQTLVIDGGLAMPA